MDSDTKRVSLSTDAALAMLDVQDGQVHALRDMPGMLIGCDWSLEDITKQIKDHGAELSGEMATGMAHGLTTFTGTEPLFLATKKGACIASDPKDGKWFLSSDEEVWSLDVPYDTKESAQVDAQDFCEEKDISFCYIGQAHGISYESVLDLDILIENMNESDEFCGSDEPIIDPSTEQLKELETLIVDWFKQTLGLVPWYSIDLSHEFVAKKSDLKKEAEADADPS